VIEKEIGKDVGVWQWLQGEERKELGEKNRELNKLILFN